MNNNNYDGMSAVESIDWENLRVQAHKASYFSYSPYSGYPVGAAAMVDNGKILVGCNVENVSTGLGLCAECSIVSQLFVQGGGRLVAISCSDTQGQVILPCGRCRQLLWEHGGEGLMIDAQPKALPLAELLPYAFGRAEQSAIVREP